MQFTFDKLGATNRTCCHEMTIDTSYKYFFLLLYEKYRCTEIFPPRQMFPKIMLGKSVFPVLHAYHTVFSTFFGWGGFRISFLFASRKGKKIFLLRLLKHKCFFPRLLKRMSWFLCCLTMYSGDLLFLS